MYYNQTFYKYLEDCYSVIFDDDGLILKQHAEAHEERLLYTEMDARDARAALHFIGTRVRRFRDFTSMRGD